jgi:hypothetical protein
MVKNATDSTRIVLEVRIGSDLVFVLLDLGVIAVLNNLGILISEFLSWR